MLRPAQKCRVPICMSVGLLVLVVSLIAADEPGAKIKGWGRVIDPDKDCEVTSKDGGVSFNIPAKPHDFANEIKVQNAPRVLSEIKGDFIAEVVVSGKVEPGQRSTLDLPPEEQRTPYHGAGLVLIKNDTTYFTMVRACLRRDNVLQHYGNFELRDGGRIADHRGVLIESPEKDIWVRLERRGDNFFGSISIDGIHWAVLDAINATLPETLSIGIVGVNTSEIPLQVRFEKLTIFKKTAVE